MFLSALYYIMHVKKTTFSLFYTY